MKHLSTTRKIKICQISVVELITPELPAGPFESVWNQNNKWR